MPPPLLGDLLCGLYAWFGIYLFLHAPQVRLFLPDIHVDEPARFLWRLLSNLAQPARLLALALFSVAGFLANESLVLHSAAASNEIGPRLLTRVLDLSSIWAPVFWLMFSTSIWSGAYSTRDHQRIGLASLAGAALMTFFYLALRPNLSTELRLPAVGWILGLGMVSTYNFSRPIRQAARKYAIGFGLLTVASACGTLAGGVYAYRSIQSDAVWASGLGLGLMYAPILLIGATFIFFGAAGVRPFSQSAELRRELLTSGASVLTIAFISALAISATGDLELEYARLLVVFVVAVVALSIHESLQTRRSSRAAWRSGRIVELEDQLRNREEQLTKIQRGERQRIANVLHQWVFRPTSLAVTALDQISQAINAQAEARTSDRGELRRVAAYADRGKLEISKSEEHARQLVAALYSESVRRGNLFGALTEVTGLEQYSQYLSISSDLDGISDLPPLPPNLTADMQCFVVEGLNNAVKHQALVLEKLVEVVIGSEWDWIESDGEGTLTITVESTASDRLIDRLWRSVSGLAQLARTGGRRIGGMGLDLQTAVFADHQGTVTLDHSGAQWARLAGQLPLRLK